MRGGTNALSIIKRYTIKGNGTIRHAASFIGSQASSFLFDLPSYLLSSRHGCSICIVADIDVHMMKVPGIGKHHDSDSTPSDDEKKVTGVEPGQFENLPREQLPPDPDAGLSEAEKARIVSTIDSEPCRYD